MSEEQNDSPAFRLRPRRSAPKSYYTVRLEYSANPAAFIRERPRSSNKKKVFTQKTGTNSTKVNTLSVINAKPFVVSKEDREREERRILLHRDISESITTNVPISPFMQRIRLDELLADSFYEHNYIILRIKDVEKSTTARLVTCFCQSVDVSSGIGIYVRLYDDYANLALIKSGKFISIGKFKTGVKADEQHEVVKLKDIAPTNGEPADNGDAGEETEEEEEDGDEDDDINILPFDVIVKHEQLVERSTTNSNRGSPLATSPSPGAGSVNRRPMIPFVSITDMIEQPTEPFVEMSPPTPPPPPQSKVAVAVVAANNHH